MFEPLARPVADLDRAQRGAEFPLDRARQRTGRLRQSHQPGLMAAQRLGIADQSVGHLRQDLAALRLEQRVVVQHAIHAAGKIRQPCREPLGLLLADLELLAHAVGEVDKGLGAGSGDLDVHAVDLEHPERALHFADAARQVARGLADRIGLAAAPGGLGGNARKPLRRLGQIGHRAGRLALLEHAGNGLQRGNDPLDGIDRGAKTRARLVESRIEVAGDVRQPSARLGQLRIPDRVMGALIGRTIGRIP